MSFEQLSDGELIGVTYENEWNKEDKSFDLGVEIAVEGDSLYFDAEGSYADIVKGESYTIDVDNAQFGFNGEELLDATGKIVSEKTDKTVEVPDSAIDALQMSESEIYELMGTFY